MQYSKEVQNLLVKGQTSSWCTACGYTAPSSNDVSRHIEAKHLDLRLECKFCPNVFRTRLNLSRHLKKKHDQTREQINEVVAGSYHISDAASFY